MGCSESKSSIAAENTVTKNKKHAAADYPKKVEKEEDVVVQQGEAKAEENMGLEGAVGVAVKETAMVAKVEKKDDTVKEKPEKLDENVKEEKVAEEKEPKLDKENGENEAATNEEGSTKEVEPTPAAEALPAVTKMADAIVPEEANPPPEKKKKVILDMTRSSARKVGRFRQPTTTQTSTQHESNLPQVTITV